MSRRFIFSAWVILLLLGCQPESNAGWIDVSECQRIETPGQYALTKSLNGAPIKVSNQALLAEPYTGSKTLEQTCIEINSSEVILDCRGNTIVGSGDENASTSGIFISGDPENPLSKVDVTNCSVKDHQFGFYGSHLEGGEITNNDARNNKSIGFYLIGLSGTNVSTNTAERNSPDGFLFIGSQNVTISQNTAYYNRMRGFTFESCQGCTVSQNESYSNGVLGFGIYASLNMTFEKNTAHDNRYHGFAILHEAGTSTFIRNESYNNDAAGFYVESSDNQYSDNLSHDNKRDGIVIFKESSNNTFEGNTLKDNGGYGVFSDKPNSLEGFESNKISGNQLGDLGSGGENEIDWCGYTGFGMDGPCDPVFQGGPNLKDPEVSGSTSEILVTEAPQEIQTANDAVILSTWIEGDPIAYPSFGDLWMSTWADDDRLFMTWGDGIGFGDGYPVGYPAYTTLETIKTPTCGEYEIFCQLWCGVFGCEAGDQVPVSPLTDAGLLWIEGDVPEFFNVGLASLDVPTGEPFFLRNEAGEENIQATNDKPSSILFVDGRLIFAGHSPAGEPTIGYLAYSEDYGQTFTQVPNSPWSSNSPFRVMMFINMGKAYALNNDGYVYALAVGKESLWLERTVYLARVPTSQILDYGAYEYYAGTSGDQPNWSIAQSQAVPLDNLYSSGQGSAVYHKGTGQYLFITSDGAFEDGPWGLGALYQAPFPWGPWTMVSKLCFDYGCIEDGSNLNWTDGKYIPGLLSKGSGPDWVYFSISGHENYQLQIGKLVFEVGQ